MQGSEFVFTCVSFLIFRTNMVNSQFLCEYTKMDKRELAALFRDRLRKTLESDERSTAAFLRDTGVDRSALSQFLDPKIDRMPRAETLRSIANACGVSTDWLLSLENAPDGRQKLAASWQIEQARDEAASPLHKWREEASGHKLRYVPSTLPDMLNLKTVSNEALGESSVRGEGKENVLGGLMPGDMDIEIAMPLQTIEDLANQTGLWRNEDPKRCREQLRHMMNVCNESYPALRLHLYDGRKTYSAPFSVFGKLRVALYLGDAYLVLTQRDEIRTFVNRFDQLVRSTQINPNEVGAYLAELANKTER